jgi:hypothetical protein
VRTEGILTQLVFNHALRIRMKAELPEGTGADSNPSTAATSPDNASFVEQPPSLEASESSRGSGDETLVQPSSSSIKSISDSSKGKQKAKDAQSAEDKSAPKAKAAADNLVGKINNLVTTDLNNITEGRDFLFICEYTLRYTEDTSYLLIFLTVVYVPLTVSCSVWFLHSILGWSAFVGLAIMVILFPIPGYVAKIIQGVQVTRMEKVGIFVP